MKTRLLVVVPVVTVAILLSASPAMAAKGDREVRFGVLSSIPTSDLTMAGQTTELDESFGIQGGFEFGITDLLGVEPAINYVSHDVTVRQSGVPDLALGEVDSFSLLANVNFHLLGERRTDFYVGPTVGYAFWSDLETDVFPQDFPTDDGFMYGVNVGIDLPFGDGNWAFAGAFNYIISELSVEGASADIGIDPIQLKAGVSYRF